MPLSDLYKSTPGGSKYDRFGNRVDSRPTAVQNIYTSAPQATRGWVDPNLTPMSAPEAPTGRANVSPYTMGLVNPIYDLPYTGSLPTVDPNSKANQLGLGGVNTAFQTQRDRDGGIRDMRSPINKQFYSGLGVDPTLGAMAGYRNGSEAGEFMMNHGVDAFLGGYTNAEFGGGRMTSPGEDGVMVRDGAGGINALRGLAAQTGYADADKYADSEQGKRALYDDLNTYLKDYWGVSGKDPRASYGDKSATRALYKDDGTGTLQAVSNPRVFAKPAKDNGFIGREGLTALSMVLPMFGGWAGMLGQGAAGTLSAGSGLGLTTGLGSAIGTGATNALVNAGMGALTNGSGGQGFLGGLAGSLGGAAMGSMTGGANNLGSMFDTANAGMSTFSPMGAFQSGLGRLGLGNSPVGRGVQLAGHAGRLANLFRN